MYTLGQAARAAGKSKATISKAVRAGRISAARGSDGTYQIDPAELHRVYQPAVALPSTETATAVHQETAALERENALLREMLERERGLNRELAGDRDHWRAQATALLEDRRPERPRRSGWWPFGKRDG